MLKKRIQDEMKSAMKAREKRRLGIIRLILAAVKQREVDERIELDDTQVLAVLDTALLSLAVLDAQVGRYEELGADAGALHRFLNPDLDRYVDPQGKLIWNDEGQAVFTFGKVKGVSLQDVAAKRDSRGYLEWILKSDFSPEVKDIIRSALSGVFPKR